MDTETQREIAMVLRQAIGKGQAMILLDGAGQLPLEVQAVERGVVRLVGQMGIMQTILGQQVQTTVPVNYTVALERILGVGVIVDPAENGNGGAGKQPLTP
jgi:hypothetical protein